MRHVSDAAIEEPVRVLFLYWGRRGLTRFALELARAAMANPHLKAAISVSRQNEAYNAFVAACGSALWPVDTFQSNIGAVTQAVRLPALRRDLRAFIAREKIQVVVELMPHVWSLFIADAIKGTGARYVTIAHDASSHPGDHRSRWVMALFAQAMRRSDLVLTLGDTVTQRLAANAMVPRAKIRTLFHPDLNFSTGSERLAPATGDPIRLLFLGRIMAYKGLPLFLDAVDLLRASGMAVAVGVFGEGELGAAAARLDAMGAEVVNRWLTDDEIGAVLPRYHAIVLSHVEASQSGVAATALGAQMPVVATPVGGLVEQIKDGQTGVMAERADAPALAAAIRRLFADPALYRTISANIRQTGAARSMDRFVGACVDAAMRTDA